MANDIYDYKPNSHKYKERQKELERDKRKLDKDQKKIEKVVKGNVRTRKNNVRKLTNTFISEDMENVKTYVFMDVLIPAVKKALSDIICDGFNMLLYGDTRGGKRNSNASYVSYRNYSSRNNTRHEPSRMRSGYSFDDIVLESRGEAEEVLSRMDELLEMYEIVSVADLYDLVGITHDYTDNNYGWTNIRTAEVVRVRNGGYMLKLPKVLPIK